MLKFTNTVVFGQILFIFFDIKKAETKEIGKSSNISVFRLLGALFGLRSYN